MDPSFVLALKKVLGGIASIILIAVIKKTKSASEHKTRKTFIENQFRQEPKRARALYGNDVNDYLTTNYPVSETFPELLITNAFRPLLVLILISLLDLNTLYISLFALILVFLVVPIEIHYGNEWKNKWWYMLGIIIMWTLALCLLYNSIDEQNQQARQDELKQEMKVKDH